jgi:hypothetical protein
MKYAMCRVCRRPMSAAKGQIIFYHAYCRKYRHNRRNAPHVITPSRFLDRKQGAARERMDAQA